MYAIIGVFGILFATVLGEVFFNVQTTNRVRDWLNKLFVGKGYLRFFGLTALFALGIYAVGALVMGPFMGLYAAGTEIGTMFLLTFLVGWIMCICSFSRDVGSVGRSMLGGAKQKASHGMSLPASVTFVTALWGCAILLTFYDHSVSGSLLTFSVFP